MITRWQQHVVTNLMAVDAKIRGLHKVAEDVCVVLQVCRGEQSEILHHAVGDHLLVEEPV